MSRLQATTPVEVQIGPCKCEGTPHEDGDKAWLRPRLLPEDGLTALSMFQSGRGELATEEEAVDALAGRLGLHWVISGLLRWNLLDDDGEPIPADETTLRSGGLDWEDTLLPIAEAGDRLYSPSVLVPLGIASSGPSEPGPMEASTSAMTDSSETPPKQ